MPKAAPIISVLLPVYNAAQYLHKSIESILLQSFTDFEIIAVDDGSTDDSPIILKRLATRDSRLRIIRRPNTGIVGALNDAIDAAQGAYLARMDSDDVSMPDRFFRQLSYLSQNPDCVAVGSDIYYTDPEGDLLVRHKPALSNEQIMEELQVGNGGALIHPTIMMRAQAVRAAGSYRKEFQWVEDLDLYMRLSSHGKLANLPQILLHYRQHSQSVNKRMQDRTQLAQMLVDAFRVQRQLPPYSLNTNQILLKTRADFRRHWAYDAVKGGKLGSARKNAFRSILNSPFSKPSWVCLRYINRLYKEQNPNMKPVRRWLHAMMEASSFDSRIDETKINLRLEQMRARSLKTLDAPTGNNLIHAIISEGKPAAIAKIGDRECSALAWHLGLRQFYKYTWTAPAFGESDLTTQGGVFPNSPELFHRFATQYLEDLRSMDAMAVWHNPGETSILQNHCPGAKRMDLVAFDAYFFSTPWTSALAGKRVLVVHPFDISIPQQHAKLRQIWEKQPEVMPDFELRLIKSPYGFSQPPFPDWIAMLNDLKQQMTRLYKECPFDVALLGCGAAGLPLAAHAKALGAVGVHTGGITQLLFGIRGGRWDLSITHQKLFNQHWIRPAPSETPPEASKVDKAGYW